MPTHYEQNHLYRTPGPTGGKTGFESATDKAKTDKPTPRTPGLDHHRLAAAWADVDAVRGGTRTMRDLGEAYLPMEPGEDPDAYSRRLSRAVLTPIYTRLVRAFVSMILRKPVRVQNTGNLSEAEYRAIAGFKPGKDEEGDAIAGHLDDIDQEGSDIQQFAYDWLCEAIHYGHAGVEVIYPTTKGIQTRAEEVTAGIRPYWSIYPGPRILAECCTSTNGKKQRTQVRLLQSVLEPDGPWGEREVEQVLVYVLGDDVEWQIWREGKDENWEMYDAGAADLNGLAELPFVFLHSDRKGQKLPPPMLEVLHLNIRHYQISADMDNSLHVVAVPRLLFFGCNPEDLGAVGSVNEAICIPNPEARAEWTAPDPTASLKSRPLNNRPSR